MSCSIQFPSGVNSGVESKTSLSSPLRAAAPSKDPSCNAGLASAAPSRTAGRAHFDGAVQHRADVDTPKRRRHQAEVGKSRIAPANIRGIAKREPEIVFVGQMVEIGAAIGDGDEAPADGANACLSEPMMKIEKLRERLDRLAGLAGDDK